jgi:hypothetical protein
MHLLLVAILPEVAGLPTHKEFQDQTLGKNFVTAISVRSDRGRPARKRAASICCLQLVEGSQPIRWI